MSTINKTASSGNVVLPRTIGVLASRIDALEAALNEQFPHMTSRDAGPYQLLFASQSDPKGNIQVWQAKQDVCTVSLTGALTSLVIPE
jgi:hypothetical protein